ncbi:hypothetical protein [Streptomyces sp. NPDC004284]|uniref:hypothetical protein n=1 Tax=Streptomyces sp. NPDC004284 TaxID=3364695 RepID=UPI0036D1A11C
MKPRPSRRVALAALVLCLLCTAAAAVSFARGSWAGLAWVLAAGFCSNAAWYCARGTRAVAWAGTAGASATSCAGGAVCGSCGRQAC